MKRLTMALTALVSVCFVNEIVAQSSAAPYVAGYTSSFNMGNAEYANKVLELWKDWDDNQLDRHDYFADTLVIWLPDGSVVKGKKANADGAKQYRASFAKVKSTVHAWVPLYSTDTKDNIVCIWGTEENTAADGKVSTRDLHEVWWFNKDGKVTVMRQWTSNFGTLPN
jgi:hypothetical protein